MSDFDNRPHDASGQDRIEALLRRSLETRAQDVRPDPATWQKVSRRMNRAQRMRWALAGATGFAAIAVAAVVLPGVLDRNTVDFVPPATQPPEAGREGETGIAGAGSVACGGPEHVAAVFARSGQELEGTLWAHCDDGSESHLSQARPTGARDVNPAFAPDGTAIVFERVGADGVSQLVHLDLAGGQEQVLGGGALPAFAPDGRLAWVQRVDGGQDLILVGDPFAEPEMEFPVMDGEDGEWFDARRLAWDAAGETLYAEIGYEESVVYAYDPGTGEGRRLEEPIAEERYAGPSTAPDGLGVAVLARCCLATDGQAFDGADLRLVDSDDGRLLNQMPEGFDADGPVWTAYAPMGELREVEGTGLSWSGGTRAAWLVGDGEDLWIVEGDGTVHEMGVKISGAAANPALSSDGPAPSPGGMAAEQVQLPADVAATRDAIHRAAEARDFEALRALMAEDFSYSFGEGPGADGAVRMLREMDQRGEDPFALLMLLLGTEPALLDAESAGGMWFWPGVQVRTPEEWTDDDVGTMLRLGASEQDIEAWRGTGYGGWRLGIDESGAWRILVAGD